MGLSLRRVIVFLTIFSALIFTSCTFWSELSNPKASNLYHRGEKKLSNHQFTEAVESFKKLANNYPDCKYGDDALFKAGYIYVIQKDYEKANKTFQTLKNRYTHSDHQFSTNLWIEITDTILQLSSQKKGKEIEKKIVEAPEDKEAGKPDTLTSKERKELKRLRKQNRKLKKRLKKLEEAIGNME